MDGNGRWARRRFRPRAYGHRMGVQNMFKICGHAFNLGVRIVTVFALSAENLSRPKEEVDELFELFRSYFSKKRERMFELNVKICVLGDISVLPADIQDSIGEIERATAHLTSGLLNICVNYGARQELVRAVNKAVALGRFVDENSLESMFYTAGLPDPDLIIRTGGEQRLSNFLLWQSAYSELYFCDTFWPDFREEEFRKAIVEYQSRERRFGKTSEQLK